MLIQVKKRVQKAKRRRAKAKVSCAAPYHSRSMYGFDACHSSADTGSVHSGASVWESHDADY